MQIGQGELQGILHAGLDFHGDALFEQRALRGLGALLQLAGGVETDSSVMGHQPVAGQRGIQQAAQTVVQAQFFRLASGRGVAFGGVVAAVFAEQERLALCIDGYAT
ncbi:hypothetical protein D9M71_508110 [compost metagenome]